MLNYRIVIVNVVYIIGFQCNSLYAQSNPFKAGLLLNFNGIEITGQSDMFWNSLTGRIWGMGGASVGLFVKKDLSKKLNGIAQIRYIGKGSLYEFTNEYGVRTFEALNLRYVEVPILLGCKIPLQKTTCYLETGFAVARMFASKLSIEDLFKRMETPGIDQFNNYDFCWIGELKLPLIKKKKDKWLLGVRVSRSIVSIHEIYKLYNFDYGVEVCYLLN
ncbi:MAG: hypothetical protein K9H64_03555 [Bacteroidales bacterium]|nr:hypothetical protein [Bacteroidales bacterium]MCF8457405.1 hypothetical protein [Bacteroidales bacterium]